MPIPAFAGIPSLATWLGTAFGALVTWFSALLTKRLAVIAAAIVFFTVITVAFVAAINAAFATVSYLSPPYLTTAASWFLPENTEECIAVMGAGRLAAWVYH